MSRSLSRFAAEQLPSLEQSLRAMEPMIDGWLTKTADDGTVVPADGVRWDVPELPVPAEPTDLRWDFPERSKLLQATRFLTYSRAVGKGTLMIARAVGTPKQNPQERLYGVATPKTSIEWYSSDVAIDDDIICTRFGMEKRGDLRRVAAGLLGCLERAAPIEDKASEVDMPAHPQVVTALQEKPAAFVAYAPRELAAFMFPPFL